MGYDENISLEEENESLKKENERLNNENEILKEEISELENECDDLKMDKKEAEDELDDLKNERQEDHIDYQTSINFVDKFDDFIRRVGLSKINIDVVLFRKDLEDLLDVKR